eukprot:jgi/Psemu1/27846/gm1.27846_g
MEGETTPESKRTVTNNDNEGVEIAPTHEDRLPAADSKAKTRQRLRGLASPKRISHAEKWTDNGVVDVHKKELYSRLWIEEQKGIKKRVKRYEEDLNKMFDIMHGQLSSEICYCYNESSICPPVDVLMELKKFLTAFQDASKDPHEVEEDPTKYYVEEMQMRFEVMKAAGIKIVSDELIRYTMKRVFPDKTYKDYTDMTAADKKPITKAAEQILLMVQIVEGANRKNHRNLQGTLKGEYCLKKDAYPVNTLEVLDMLLRFKTTKNNTPKQSNNNNNNGKGKRPDGNGNAGSTSATDEWHCRRRRLWGRVVFCADKQHGDEDDSSSDSSTTNEESLLVVHRQGSIDVSGISVSLPTPIALHVTAWNEHEPHIERDHHTSKERCQCTFAAIPFDKMPPRMVIKLVNGVDFWLNSLTMTSGLNTTLSSQEIITGEKINANRHCKFQFGDYVLGHVDAQYNTMKPRTTDAIYLRPSGNKQGGFFIFDLKTGRRIHHCLATLARMTHTVIQHIHSIATEQQAPDGLMFGNHLGCTTILDLDDISSLDPADYSTDTSYHPDIADGATINTVLTGVSLESRGSSIFEGTAILMELNHNSHYVESAATTEDEAPTEPVLEKEHHAIVLVSSALEQYSNLDAALATKQYRVKKGLDIFGEAGVKAILSELKQMHGMEVVAPIHPHDMTKEQVQQSLQYLMFLKRK